MFRRCLVNSHKYESAGEKTYSMKNIEKRRDTLMYKQSSISLIILNLQRYTSTELKRLAQIESHSVESNHSIDNIH